MEEEATQFSLAPITVKLEDGSHGALEPSILPHGALLFAVPRGGSGDGDGDDGDGGGDGGVGVESNHDSNGGIIVRVNGCSVLLRLLRSESGVAEEKWFPASDYAV